MSVDDTGTQTARPVYLIEDDETVLRACAQALKLAELEVRTFASAEQALAACGDDPPAVVVSDVRMAGMSGLELLDVMWQRDREVPVILITGHGDVSMAVQAMRAHAYDFIEKPFSSPRLVDVVRRALERRALLTENRVLREQLGTMREMPLIGSSESIQRVARTIDSLAPTDVDVLIHGETGTGMEVVARAARAQRPFRPVRGAQLRRLAGIGFRKRDLRPRNRGVYRGRQAPHRQDRVRQQRHAVP